MSNEEIVEKINDELGDLIVKHKATSYSNQFIAGKIEAFQEVLEWFEE
jgi:Ni,Fe-hydrogenase III component G